MTKKITIIALASIAAFAFCGKKEIKPFTHQGFKGWAAVKNVEIKKAGETTGIIITSKVKKPNSGGSTDGAFLTIPQGIAEPFGGKKVSITFTAKTVEKKGSDFIWVSYSTFDVGNSGWKKFALTNELQAHTFEYQVPKPKKGGIDYIGFNSDITGGGKIAVVDKVEIKAAAE